MSYKIMSVLEKNTGGKSYKAHKYCLDYAERPSIDYGEDSIIWQSVGETNRNIHTYIPLKHMSDIFSCAGETWFTYFLDGSRRVFKVDDIAFTYRGRGVIYPVIAGQIGVGCCKRVNRQLKCEKYEPEFVLSLPDIADADGKPGFYPALVSKINNCPDVKRLGIEFSKVLPYKTSKDAQKKFEDLGTACVQDLMITREKEMVADLVRMGKLNQDNYLIKDGSLEYRPNKQDRVNIKNLQVFRNNYNWVLGVSKNFNPEVCKDVNGKSNPEFIAKLPLYHRTPAAKYKNPDWLGDTEFAVWYIRIRDKSRTRTPFDGVLKVEKILVTQDELENGIDSELIDALSAQIINERSPVCYGSDLRWANHLYPIYLTESYVKSKYISAQSFLQLF